MASNLVTLGKDELHDLIHTEKYVLPLTLYQLGPVWGLSSADPECIAAEAYLKLSGVPFTVVNCNNEHMSPNGKLPFARCANDTIVSGFTAIVQICQRQETNIDSHLTLEKAAEALAYASLIQSAIADGLHYELWCEDANFEPVALRTFGSSRLPFPLDQLLSWKQRLALKKAVLKGVHAQTPEQVYKNATNAFIALADHLGSQPFLFGSSPCYCDALAYGYISAATRTPLSTGIMANAVSAQSNLAPYVERIAALLREPRP